MNSQKKKERNIIILTCIATISVVIGFTLMQGTIKDKDDKYISQESNLKSESILSKSSYEIIKNKNINKDNTYVILEKKPLTSDEIILLINEAVKNNTDEFNMYIFNNKEKAINFDIETGQIEKLVKSKEDSVEVQIYNYIENEVDSIPENYNVKSVKTNNEGTNIEIDIKPIDKPEKALAQIKFLGQSIKELNTDKKLGDLTIKACHKDNKNISWNYSSENKKLIVKSEILEI